MEPASRTAGVLDVTGTATLALDTLVIEPGTPDPSYDTDGNGVNDSDFHVDGGGVIIVDLMNLSRGSDCGVVTDVNLATNSITVDIKLLLGSTVRNHCFLRVDRSSGPRIPHRWPPGSYRNNLRLADGIEDLQITYFMDMDGDNSVDVGELRGDSAEHRLPRLGRATRAICAAVRLNVVARTRSEDDQIHPGLLPGHRESGRSRRARTVSGGGFTRPSCG